jgi:cellulose synthase/poly-beta-1,6-N-acetylglucosamine synthase-like glycosyltransferase
MPDLIAIIEAIALIPTSILLGLILVQYGILLFGRKEVHDSGPSPSVSVLIPAHNEGRYIAKTVESVQHNGYPGKLEIIVADDGSTDDTPNILKELARKSKQSIRAIRTNHIGKSRAMNRMIGMARHDIVVTIDGDTCIEKGSLEKLVAPFADGKVAATTGSMKIANHGHSVITWFQRLEYFGFSLFNHMCNKANGMYCTAGTLSAFRRSVLNEMNGFNDRVLIEDKDLGLRMRRAGHKISYVPKAVAYTNTPERWRHLLRQRMRWSKGGIQVIKDHRGLLFRRKLPGIGFFSMPVMSYWYFHSAIIILIALQVLLGYNTYFLSTGTAFSIDVAQYFLFWFSIFGAINLAFNTLTGVWPMTLLAVENILIVALTYVLMLYSIKWMGERIRLRDALAMVFMFPYWIIIMAVNLASNMEWFRRPGLNRWDKK